MTDKWNERFFCLTRGLCNNQELISPYCILIVFQLSIKMINPIDLEFLTFFVIEERVAKKKVEYFRKFISVP